MRRSSTTTCNAWPNTASLTLLLSAADPGACCAPQYAPVPCCSGERSECHNNDLSLSAEGSCPLIRALVTPCSASAASAQERRLRPFKHFILHHMGKTTSKCTCRHRDHSQVLGHVSDWQVIPVNCALYSCTRAASAPSMSAFWPMVHHSATTGLALKLPVAPAPAPPPLPRADAPASACDASRAPGGGPSHGEGRGCCCNDDGGDVDDGGDDGAALVLVRGDCGYLAASALLPLSLVLAERERSSCWRSSSRNFLSSRLSPSFSMSLHTMHMSSEPTG